MNDRNDITEKLAGSQVYQDYERAFSEATGLPVTLQPVESWQLPHHGRRKENPFCAYMAQKSRSCAACLQTQQALAESAREEAKTVNCIHGLSDTAVPVRLGDRLVGFLQTGQIFRKKPTAAQYERTEQLAKEWGIATEPEKLRRAYFDTRVLSSRQHESVVKLLSIFAQHLSIISNRIVVEEDNSELPVIRRAKAYIQQNYAQNLSLDHVAKTFHTSMYYFCKLFRSVTGLHFTNYVCRVRVEKAKNLLLNPNLRVSEIAYEVGFKSLTHFNRVFKRIIGQSPSEYRAQIKCA